MRGYFPKLQADLTAALAMVERGRNAMAETVRLFDALPSKDASMCPNLKLTGLRAFLTLPADQPKQEGETK